MTTHQPSDPLPASTAASTPPAPFSRPAPNENLPSKWRQRVRRLRLIGLAACAVAASAVGVGIDSSTTRAASTALNVIVSDPTGTIAVGETITYPVRIENPGTDPVTLTSFTSSLGDPVTCPTDQTIAAGDARLCSTDHVVTAAEITSGTLDLTVDAQATVTACNVGPLTPELLNTTGNAFEFTDTFENGQTVKGYQFNGSLKDVNGNEAARFHIQVESNGAQSGSRASIDGSDVTWQFDNISDASPPSRVRYVINAVTDGFVSGGTITTDGMPPVTNGAVNDATGFRVGFENQATGAILLAEDQLDEVINANAGDTLIAGTTYNLTDNSVTGSEAPQYTVQYSFNDIVAGNRADFWFNQFGAVRYEQHLLSLNLTGCSTAPVTISGSDTKSISTWNPGLTLAKSAPAGTLAVGETVTYSFDVANTGNVELADITLDDPLTPDESCTSTTLAAGASMTCSASYVVTQADVDAGSLDNAATVTAYLPDGTTSVTESATSSASITANGSMSVAKTATPAGASLGDTITYAIVVTNTGNVTLDSVTVDDPLTTDESCPAGPVAPGASITCGATYTITVADADAGTVTNTATVTALDSAGTTVSAEGANIYPVAQIGGLSVTKTASPVGASLGDTITYSIVATNTGNVTLNSVAVDDPLTTDESCPTDPVAPGGSITCTATYTITAADADAGTIANTATVVALDPGGTQVSGVGSNAYDVAQDGSVSVAKTGNIPDVDGDGIPQAGDPIDYTITVTNSGTVTVDSIVVTDPIGTPTCDGTSIAVGQVITCTVSDTLAQADIDAGTIANTATAQGTDPGGAAVSGSDTANTAIIQNASITVTKSTPTQTLVVDDTLNYSILVYNVGNVTVDAISVSDPLAPDAACPAATLAPSGQMVCTASYVVTQADVDAGTVSNTATVTAAAADGTNLSVSSSYAVPSVQTPSLAMTKTGVASDTDSDGKVEAGETIDYTFVVTNTGNVEASSLSITDPNTTTPVCNPTTLVPAQMATCTASHTLTQLEIDAGAASNTATANALDPSGGSITTTANTTTAIEPVPALRIEKSGTPVDADDNGQLDVDEPINYTITVTNTGNVTLDTIAVSDPLTGPPSCDVDVLSPGQVATCTASYPLTQGVVDLGAVTNDASVTGLDPLGAQVGADVSTTNTIEAVPSLSVVKTGVTRDADDDGTIEVGEFIDYTITVTNTGNVTIVDLGVQDPSAGVPTCDKTSLPSNAVATCTVTVTLTQSDFDLGDVFNTATATGTDPNDVSVTAEGSEMTMLNQTASISVTKTGTWVDSNDDGIAQPGETIDFTITVTNDGNVTVSNLAVSDPAAGDPTCDLSTLSPNGIATCTVSYTLTQADVDGGEIINSATATATDPGDTSLEASGQASVLLVPDPKLSVVKTGTWNDTNENQMVDAGEPIDYVITVTNTGNVTIGALAVIDALVGEPTCDTDTLASGEAATCLVSYTITEADIVAGSFTNTANATGTDPQMVSVSASGTTSTELTAEPNLVASKVGTVVDVNGDGVTAPGDQIRYMVMLTNTGNVTMSNIVVDDPMTAPPICDPTVLPPGASTDCAVLYTLTQSDIDSREIRNTAIVTGTDPSGVDLNVSASELTTIEWVPKVEVTKSATVDTFTAGSVVTYSIVVLNTGNVNVDGISISDPLTTDESCPSATLAPGEQMTCTATYTLTQADVDAGSIDNTASVSGSDPAGGEVLGSSTATTPFTQTPGLTMIKTGTATDDDANGQIDAGDSVSYVITVTNSGNVSLTGVAVSDPLVPDLTCDLSDLLPGEQTTCRGAYVVTQPDIHAGAVTNTASAEATDPNEGAVTAEATEVTPITQKPQLSVDTVGAHGDTNSDGAFQSGETIEYTTTVTNTGNVSIGDLVVTDPTLGAWTCDPTTLDPDQSATCTISYTLTQADVDSGRVSVTPTAGGLAPNGTAVSATDPVDTAITPAPELTVLKSADVSSPFAGDTITYTITVANSGNVTITDIAVTDDLLENQTCSGTAAAPAEVITCTGTYTVTQADVDNGTLVNTATAAGRTPAGDSVTGSGDASTPFGQQPAVSSVMTAWFNDPNEDGIPQILETIDYTITVTNVGNVTLVGVAVDDPSTGLSVCVSTVLAPGAATECYASHVLTAADIDAGGITNTAKATAIAPDGSTVWNEATVSTTLDAAPSLTLTKVGELVDVNANAMPEAGETMDYRITIANTGNVTIFDVGVTDAIVANPGCDLSSLGANEAIDCNVSYTLTQSDIDAGTITNTATATGTPPTNTPISAQDTTTDDLDAVPALRLTLSAVEAGGNSIAGEMSTPGTPVDFRIVVTNTGNVTLTDLVVGDAMSDGVTCPTNELAPHGQMMCKSQYVLTQSNIDAGMLENAATADAMSPAGTPVNDDAAVALPLLLSPDVVVAQASEVIDADGNQLIEAGDTIRYTITVTNTGNVTISDLTVDDPAGGTVTCDVDVLAPGQFTTCTVEYAITQTDIDTGTVDHPVTATGVGLDRPEPSTIEVVLAAATTDTVTGVAGEPIVVDVLSNDSLNLRPETLRLLDADGNPVMRLEVPGEGVWTVTDGKLVFTPADGFTGDATPVKYVATTQDGLEVVAEVWVVVEDPAATTTSTTATTTTTTPSSSGDTTTTFPYTPEAVQTTAAPPNNRPFPNGGLPETGLGNGPMLAAVAAVLAGAGMALLVLARLRRPPTRGHHNSAGR